jgi:hypothetical protein
MASQQPSLQSQEAGAPPASQRLPVSDTTQQPLGFDMEEAREPLWGSATLYTFGTEQVSVR